MLFPYLEAYFPMEYRFLSVHFTDFLALVSYIIVKSVSPSVVFSSHLLKLKKKQEIKSMNHKSQLNLRIDLLSKNHFSLFLVLSISLKRFKEICSTLTILIGKLLTHKKCLCLYFCLSKNLVFHYLLLW